MTQLGIERLEKLLDFVEKTPAFKRFDFSQFRNECGTAGCLAGNLPACEPEDWEGTLVGLPMLRIRDSSYTDRCLERWFKCNKAEALHLFYPQGQRTDIYGGVNLTGGSRLKTVVRNARIFIERQKAVSK